jgi:hypothetical protein
MGLRSIRIAKAVPFFPPDVAVASDDQWVCTRSGRKFFPLEPKPDQICIEDIAYGLAGKYRFGGQSPVRYTVAQHSVEVCRWLAAQNASVDACQWGLMHDVAEAWLVDWQRPVKWQQQWYDDEEQILLPFAAVEFRILAAVTKLFGLSNDYFLNITALFRLVDSADFVQLLRERRDLLITANQHGRT